METVRETSTTPIFRNNGSMTTEHHHAVFIILKISTYSQRISLIYFVYSFFSDNSNAVIIICIDGVCECGSNSDVKDKLLYTVRH